MIVQSVMLPPTRHPLVPLAWITSGERDVHTQNVEFPRFPFRQSLPSPRKIIPRVPGTAWRMSCLDQRAQGKEEHGVSCVSSLLWKHHGFFSLALFAQAPQSMYLFIHMGPTISAMIFLDDWKGLQKWEKLRKAQCAFCARMFGYKLKPQKNVVNSVAGGKLDTANIDSSRTQRPDNTRNTTRQESRAIIWEWFKL